MQPLYFGRSGCRLYGSYHPPEGQSTRSAAVLICPLAPQEQMRAGWALQTLAAQLAKLDFHVLRFDYSGTGDSEGELSDVDLDAWRADILTAASELRDISGGATLSVVGPRLGGSLALTTPALKPRSLVLWDPLASGVAYLRELEERHRYRHETRLGRPSGPGELLGYVVGSAWRSSLERLDLQTPPWASPKHLALMSSDPGSTARSLEPVLRAVCPALTVEALPERIAGAVERDLNLRFMGPVSLQRITAWFAGPRP